MYQCASCLDRHWKRQRGNPVTSQLWSAVRHNLISRYSFRFIINPLILQVVYQFSLLLLFILFLSLHHLSIIKQISGGFYNLKHSETLNLSPVTRLPPRFSRLPPPPSLSSLLWVDVIGQNRRRPLTGGTGVCWVERHTHTHTHTLPL